MGNMAVRNSQPKGVIISPQAKEDISNILFYLSQNWNQEVTNEFLKKLEVFYFIVSINPRLFGYFNKQKNIRKYAITKQNIIYYRNKRKEIQIITVFDARQHPSKLKKLLQK
jgi:plasmid stabilization system protein ParE